MIGTALLDTAGNASVGVSTLTVGNHTITATYPATGTFAGSSASMTQQVNGLGTKAVLSANPATIQTGDSVTLTTTVTDLTGTGTPTGTVTFLDGGTTLQTASLAATGTVSISTTTLSPGAHSLGCTYSGDTVYSPATCAAVPFTVQTADTAMTLVPSANPTPALTPVTFTAKLTSRGQPNAGAVQFSVDGSAVQGGTPGPGGTTTIQIALAAGSHTVAAQFAGSSGFNPSSASVTETATQNPTATTLGVPPAPLYQNQSFSIGFRVQPLAGTAQPYGTVVLLDSATAIASQSIAPGLTNPVFNFNVVPLAPGTHLLSAVYTPADGNFAASSSGQVSAVVLAQTFTFTAEAPAMTIATEHHGSMPLTLTSVGGWTGPVRLACAAPLPPALSCELTPGIALAADASVSTMLTLDTDAVLNFKSSLSRPADRSRHGASGLGGTALAALAGLLPVALLGLRRRLRGAVSLLLLAFALLGSLTALTGCGGHYPDHTPPGTYNLRLTATGTSVGASAPSTQTVQVTLVVTP
jgi:hypothetical protein